MNTQKSAKTALILTNIFIVLLILFTVALPWLVSWYVEIRNRSASLPATIMVTCYPCAPFTAVALFSLRRLLKNILNFHIFVTSNITYFNRISVCCIIIAVVTLIAGRYYLPFYIVGATFAFLSLLIFTLKSIFSSAIESLSLNEPSETDTPEESVENNG